MYGYAPRRGQRQPQSPVGVDVAKANAMQLQYVTLRDQVLQVNAQSSMLKAGTVGLAANASATGLSFSASGGNLAYIFSNRTFSASEGFTLEVLCAVTSVASLSGFFGLQQQAGSGTARGLLGFGGANNRNIYFWGYASDIDSGVEWRVDGLLQHVMVTSDGGAGTPMKFYRDGREIASATTPGTLATTVNPAVVVGDMNQGWNACPVGTILKGAFYRRALSPSEIADLYRDPWQVFKSPNSRRLELIDATAATFRAAWARGSNQFIGSGVHAS